MKLKNEWIAIPFKHWSSNIAYTCRSRSPVSRGETPVPYKKEKSTQWKILKIALRGIKVSFCMWVWLEMILTPKRHQF